MNKGGKVLLAGAALFGIGTGIYLLTRSKPTTPTLPFYPNPGTETVLNEPGHYIGWFEAFQPYSGTIWDFVPAPGWVLIGIKVAPVGTHGGNPNSPVSQMTQMTLEYQG